MVADYGNQINFPYMWNRKEEGEKQKLPGKL